MLPPPPPQVFVAPYDEDDVFNVASLVVSAKLITAVDHVTRTYKVFLLNNLSLSHALRAQPRVYVHESFTNEWRVLQNLPGGVRALIKEESLWSNSLVTSFSRSSGGDGVKLSVGSNGIPCVDSNGVPNSVVLGNTTHSRGFQLRRFDLESGSVDALPPHPSVQPLGERLGDYYTGNLENMKLSLRNVLAQGTMVLQGGCHYHG